MKGEIRELKFKKFEPETMRGSSISVFIGGRNTGKSYCMKDIMYYHRSIPMGVMICPTNKFNKNFTGIIPPKCIRGEYSEELIDSLFRRQLDIADRVEIEPTRYAGMDSRIFIGLDDMGFDKNWKKDLRILEIMMNGRHPQITFFLSLQYCLSLRPEFRTNFDYIFVFKHAMKNEKLRLFTYFGGMFENFAEFNHYLNKMTDNFGCMVIDTRARTNSLTDSVFFYRAKDNGAYRMFDDRFWQNASSQQRMIDRQVHLPDRRQRPTKRRRGGGGVESTAKRRSGPPSNKYENQNQ